MKAVFRAAWPYQKDVMNLPPENLAAAIPHEVKSIEQLAKDQNESRLNDKNAKKIEAPKVE